MNAKNHVMITETGGEDAGIPDQVWLVGSKMIDNCC